MIDFQGIQELWFLGSQMSCGKAAIADRDIRADNRWEGTRLPWYEYFLINILYYTSEKEMNQIG